MFTALRDQYIALLPTLTPRDLLLWGNAVLDILVKALAEKGLILQIHLEMAEGGDSGSGGGIPPC